MSRRSFSSMVSDVSDGLIMACNVDLGQPDATRTHTVEVARSFAAEGLQVQLIARGPDPKVSGVSYTETQGIVRQRVRRAASLNAHLVRHLWQRRKTARRLYVRYDWSLVLSLLTGRMLGYRVVTQVDDVAYGRGYEPDIPAAVDYFKRALTVIMGRVAHGIVAVTPEIRNLLVEQFHVPSERIAVLPNGVDIDFFRPLPREDAIRRLSLDPDLRYIVFCGHFAPWVDFETILGAFAIVARNRQDTRLLLVGDGVQRPQIERQMRELRIEDVVTITGFVDDRAKVRDFVAASVVALSANRLDRRSRIGVSPVKVAEYLAAGRAVVATDLPGLRRTLAETGAGIVVPIEAAAMSTAILDLLDPKRADQFGVHGRKVAEERFAWRTIVRRTLPLFGI